MKHVAIPGLVILGACATPQQQSSAPQQQMPFNAFPSSHGGPSSLSVDDGEYSFSAVACRIDVAGRRSARAPGRANTLDNIE
jgi:hypothetical protein